MRVHSFASLEAPPLRELSADLSNFSGIRVRPSLKRSWMQFISRPLEREIKIAVDELYLRTFVSATDILKYGNSRVIRF
jgi:hypothetical protein